MTSLELIRAFFRGLFTPHRELIQESAKLNKELKRLMEELKRADPDQAKLVEELEKLPPANRFRKLGEIERLLKRKAKHK